MVECLKCILSDYETTSGQAINYSKFALFFGKNLENSLCTPIANSLAIFSTIDNGKYWGLSSRVGRNKRSIFGFLKDCI